MKDLAKGKLAQLTKALESAQAAFSAEVDALAETARAEILPYFKAHRLDFTAGAGWGWSISKPSRDKAAYHRPEDFVQDGELPQRIRELLNLEVAYNHQLGLHIRDIERGCYE